MNIKEKTVQDFGEQWTAYPENEGVYAGLDTLRDLCGPLFDIEKFKGATVADIGSGNGRIVNMLLEAGAARVIAVEPSKAFEMMLENTKANKDRITYLNIPGDALQETDLDYVVSFGVIHHIHEPDSTMRAMYSALKSGGQALIWLYGKEGNGLYLFFARPLRVITKRLPHKVLHYFAKMLDFFLRLYIKACKHFKLPMYEYMNNVLAKWTPHIRFITIYDQLNPAYAKYYTQAEVVDLMSRAGFKNIRLYHRHGYSWTVVGDRE